MAKQSASSTTKRSGGMKCILFLLFCLSLSASNSYGQNVGVGNTSPQSKLDVSGDLALREGSPIAVSAGVNAITLPAAKNSLYRLTGAPGAFSISNISSGNNGMVLTLVNETGQTMTVSNNANIQTGTGADVIAASISLIYSAALGKWIVTGAQGSASSVSSVSNTVQNDSISTTVNGIAGAAVPISNIYTSNGILNSSRTVTMGADTLTFNATSGSLNFNTSTGSVAMGNGTTASGSNSTATGNGTVASGINSTAMGYRSTASNNNSTAMGVNDTASGDASTALGDLSVASGYISTALGYATQSTGQASTAIGFYNQATGDQSMAMGNNTKASGTNSTSMGNNTTASGFNSTSMGLNNIASNNNSTAMGVNNIASGDASTAMGYNTVSGNNQSTAMGNATTASGAISTAMGYGTTASGMQSTAMNNRTIAAGDNSTAAGYQISALSFDEFAIGQFNTSYTPASTTSWSNTDRLFGIGNGTGISATSDALVVLKNGNTGLGTSIPGYQLTLSGAGTNDAFAVDNGNIFVAKNASGSYENYLYPRWIDNVMYINYGSGGFNVRNNSNVSTMFMTDSGNIGIGTTSPSAQLHTTGSVRFAGLAGTGNILSIDASGNLSRTTINTNTGSLSGTIDYLSKFITADSVGNSQIYDNGTDVGIGTTSPQYKLDVTDRIQLREHAGNGGAGMWLYQATPARDMAFVGMESDSLVGLFGNAGAGWNLVMNVATGNVGVGTAMPGYQLTLAGAGANDAFAVDNGNIFVAKNASGTYENYLYPRWTDNVMYINYGSAGFNIRNNSNASSMFMTNSGDIGVGTTSPSAQLHTTGSVRFAGLTGTGNLLSIDASGNLSRTINTGSASGTVDYISKFITADSLGNSVIYDNGTNVGIGTNSPSQRLSVVSADNTINNIASFSAANLSQGIGFSYAGISKIGTNANSDLSISSAGTGNILLNTSGTGEVGVGTSSPSATLTVFSSGNNNLLSVSAGSAIDQSISSTSNYIELLHSSPTWQALTSGRTGYLTAVSILLLDTATTPVTVTIYNGSGVGGTVLATITESVPYIYGGVNQSFTLSTPILLTAGQVFTVAATSSGGGSIYWAYNLNTLYSGGTSSIAGGYNLVVSSYMDQSTFTGQALLVDEDGVTTVSNLRISTGGNIGIGISNPSYPLQIDASVNSTLGSFAYYNSSAAPGTSSGVCDISIKTSDRVVASEFDAVSDARIKHVIGLSNSAQDLSTLSRLQITDYRFIDTVDKGNRVMKKVIAQEVEEVYPNAVKKMTDVIPDIYAMCAIHAGQIEVKNSLKKGDKVQLIFAQRKELAEVLEADDSSFKVALKEEGPVFVFGKQVDDFRSVDYEALTTLNISATQELLKMINNLSSENTEMKKSMASLSSDVESLKTILGTKAMK